MDTQRATPSEEPTTVSGFKTKAWMEKSAADRYHDATAQANALFQLVRQELFVRHLYRHVQRGDKILDLGCGSGLVAKRLFDDGHRVVACDVSQAMLDRCREEMGTRDIELRQGSGFAIPAEDGEFDVVISRMFIQHFPDWPAILAEKARVTRTGGTIFYDFANLEHLRLAPEVERSELQYPYSTDPAQKERFYAACTEPELRKLAAELGLAVIEVIPCGLLLLNAQFWQLNGPDAVAEMNRQLDIYLGDPHICEFLMFLEDQFVAKMPKHLCYGNLTILRKTGTAPAGSGSEPEGWLAKLRAALRPRS